MKPRTIIFLLAFLLLANGVNRLGAEERLPIFDCELHYLDFNQSGDGMEALFAALDESGIASVCLMGVPLQKVWSEHAAVRPRAYESDDSPVYYYGVTDVILAREILALEPPRRARVRALICGFNPTDRNGVNHIRLMLKLYPGLWSGIGEILTRHDSLTHLTYGENARADHPALDPVYALAAAEKLPVLLHSNITSTREPDFIYLQEVERALAGHPATTFIWAHAGTSANIERRQHLQGLAATVARLLDRYPNLNIMLSWTLTANYLLTADGQPDPAWLKLVRRHPDRFLVGSDVVGRFTKLKASISEERGFLKFLPPPIARQVAYENAARLFPRPKP
jgi:hypothetical protein